MVVDFLEKPKTFRNRKKDYARKQKYKEEELKHPLHRPYERSRKTDWLDEEHFAEDDDDAEEVS